MPTAWANVITQVVGSPRGVGDIDRCVLSPRAAHTILIKTNKIEDKIFLFCVFVSPLMYKKKGLHKTYLQHIILKEHKYSMKCTFLIKKLKLC